VLSQGIAAVAILLAALIVAAHLFSTALASRLRSRADYEQEIARFESPESAEAAESVTHANGTVIPRCSRSPWHLRGSTALPWLRRLIVAGVAVGGLIGTAVLAATIGDRSTAAGIVVGGVSSAVLGGWTAFLGGSFYGILRHGLHDAITEQRKDELRGRAIQ
jgi:hypothetical protein